MTKIADDTAIIEQHPWPISIKNPDNPGINPVDPTKIHGDSFPASLAFVIARPDSYRVHVSKIGFSLRMFQRITVDLGGGCNDDTGMMDPTILKHLPGTPDSRTEGIQRLRLIMNRRCRTGQMKDAVILADNGICDILLQEAADFSGVERKISSGPCIKIVQDIHRMAFRQQFLYQVRADEASSSRHEVMFDWLVLRNWNTSLPVEYRGKFPNLQE
jgi:hypothetical protein